jgi:hypothetical protein
MKLGVWETGIRTSAGLVRPAHFSTAKVKVRCFSSLFVAESSSRLPVDVIKQIDRGPPPDHSRAKREWQGESGWYEWTLLELARYFFAVGILALVLFVPFQMKLSWLPSDAAPVLDPGLVGVWALVAVIAIGVFAAIVYRSIWSNGGWVDRKLARRRGTTPHRTQRERAHMNKP